MGILTPKKCSECGEDVPAHLRYCVVCSHDMGAPNVRSADRQEEIAALEGRFLLAQNVANASGYADVLQDFDTAVASTSSAVICRSVSNFAALLSSDTKLYATFYQEIEAGERIPEDNEWDEIRVSVDNLLFPYYAKDIHFAGLSLNGIGVTGYGGLSATLKSAAIKDRASVFDENTILFIQRHHIVAGMPLPLGYRASWANRGMLAAAKLGSKLTSTTASTEYVGILVAAKDKDADFIEVHIFGDIHRRAISRICGSEPKLKADKVLLRQISREMNDLGVIVEIT